MMAKTSKPDPRFTQGLAQLAAGEAFAAHESWEELWLECGGARARYLQGCIQLAVAVFHWQANRPQIALRLMRRAMGKWDDAAAAAVRTGEWPVSRAREWAQQVFQPLVEWERIRRETGTKHMASCPSQLPDIAD